MQRPSDSYSRFVSLAKVLLPLVALGLLATLFLVSAQREEAGGVPYADVELEEIAREQRIKAPQFSGLTEDGASVSLSAATARPEGADGRSLDAQALTFVWTSPDGQRVDVIADTGAYAAQSRTARLKGGVQIQTSTGLLVTTEALEADLSTTHLRSEGEVQAVGRIGTLDAQQMELIRKDGQYVMVFSGGVKLVYDPGQSAGKTTEW
ncbi:Lipopolysaccharide-assembly, LptC-related [Pseudoruegeria aquimaris]|uniref:Lipopolysaccharide-assembly, LptC-related n=1 Tax=Pseudoruegeria aquimaris TaxID=393663 RepID=A0A1Y5RTK4_9RHOB|nr:LPS export ABC transporter periplasmic protein LptC [Pseudoruegeria aquimaris]SLN25187.1 Lipopolysaccharide-assembly, LptC-related [Pseudoruegeria aquimaris]